MVARKKTTKNTNTRGKTLRSKRKTSKRARASDDGHANTESTLQNAPVHEETLRGVWAVLSFATAVFFLLAWFGVAGTFGETLYLWLVALFGIGYILVPISFIILSIVLFRSIDHERIGVLKVVSTALFFFAGLGFVETLFHDRGGLIGQLISTPLVYAIDSIATVVTLVALIIAALLIAFDARPQRAFPTLMRMLGIQKDKTSDEAYVLDESEDETLSDNTIDATAEETEETPEDESETQTEQTEKKTPGIFSFGDANAGPSMFSFARSDEGAYTPPPLSLLQKDKGKPSVGDVKAGANTIKRTLQNFGIDVEMDEVSIGPTVTQYAMKPAEGVRLAKIVSLQSNLELALAASPIRIEAPIPGKALVGIEVPNHTKAMLGLATVLGDTEFQNSDKSLLIALGRDIAGNPHYANISKMPHMLIAGATGAGKSVTVHDMIISLLYRKGPQDLRFVMVDPKRVELTIYNDIPHLLTPVITDPKKAILALKWLAKEMERRYDILEAEKVRDIASYHENVFEPARRKKNADEQDMPEPMPYIVAVIDELSDLMQAYPRELESAIVRLAQMSRAVGIHLVLSTQRPSVQVITGLIKANIPSRIALQVSSQIDSRTILDMGGAEKLLGAGDMLYLSGEMSKPRRIQAPYVSEQEVKKVVSYLADAYNNELPDEIDLSEVQHDNSMFSASVGSDDDDEDDLYDEAQRVIVEAGKGSTSYLQRKLRVGYARAARLMDMLEERGVVGPAEGSKPREVILHREEEDTPTEPESEQTPVEEVKYEEAPDTIDAGADKHDDEQPPR